MNAYYFDICVLKLHFHTYYRYNMSFLEIFKKKKTIKIIIIILGYKLIITS